MEAIGTLAGGIAHDFNNILMGIQGHASLILTHNDHGSSSKKDLESIEALVESGANLTRQLLAYARGGKYEVKPIDLNELIQAQNRLFLRMKKDIVLHEKLANNLWIIDADQGQMEQAILNLYINASQAMPDGGDIYIETENVIIDENHAGSFHVDHGKYIKVMISDTGVGIDESIKQRIFEPFFTTKEIGRGTGLGLASVYGIIENHGGSIFVSSEKGKGTTFTLYLPGGERKMTKENGSFTEIPKGEGGVLIVDDEDMIVSVSSRLIDKMGYTAFHASNGEEAIEVYKANMDKIDIVILDLIMPGLGGGDTFDRLKEINPDIKVLLSSGYSIDGLAQEILDRGCNGFIQKPFRVKELSDKLMGILAIG